MYTYTCTSTYVYIYTYVNNTFHPFANEIPSQMEKHRNNNMRKSYFFNGLKVLDWILLRKLVLLV